MKHLLQLINLLEQILCSSYTGFCKAQVHLHHCMIMDTCKKCNALLSWLLRFLFLDRTHFCHEGEVRVRQSWGVLTTNSTNPTLFEICIWWLNANSTKHWSIYKSWFKYPWAKGLLVVILFYVWVNFSCEPVHLGISNAFSLCVKLADRPNLVCLSKHID